jgi:cytochrome c oxidase assembly protein subunit 15
MMLADTATTDPSAAVRRWLTAVAILVFCIVLVGGATRLADAGLSITEWQPIVGIIPPLSDADWAAAFDMYKQIPEFKLQNSSMTLEEFKVIFWWEWAHRLLGRLVGLVFALPLVIFLIAGRIERRHVPRLLLLLILGAGQGVLGWYMVASGLTERVDVSQYRLAAHLTLASVIFAFTAWTVFCLGTRHRLPSSSGDFTALFLLVLVLSQIAMGGFVAGIDAGMGYNTWPRMDGQWIPDGLGAMEPAWRNLFENALTVQFIHRCLAYVLAILVLIHAWRVFSLSGFIFAYAVWLQAALGIMTLLLQVPMALALTHQAAAMLVLLAAVWHVHRRLATPSPVPGPQ